MHRNRNDDCNMDLQVEIRSNICLKSNSRHSVVEILNGRPATEAVSSQNKRSTNGNVSETGFFELHILITTHQNQLGEFAEEIAERVGRPEGITIASFVELLAHTRLSGQPYGTCTKRWSGCCNLIARTNLVRVVAQKGINKSAIQKGELLIMQTLKDSELRYRRLFETAQDGVLILDAATGMIEDVNPYLSKILGFSSEELKKKSSGKWAHLLILKPTKQPSKHCRRMNTFALITCR